MKGISPLTLKMILKTYYPLPARQASVHPQLTKVSSCSPSPMPCTKPESLRDDQTKSSYFGAEINGRKEEQSETSLEVQPNDVMGKQRDGSTTRWSDQKLRRKRTRWLRTALRTGIRGKKLFFKPRLGWSSKHHKSPLDIS